MKHRHHEQPDSGARRPIHKDWRVWVVLGLMLAAMAIYVLSNDDSFTIRSRAGQSSPAAATPSP